MKPPTSISPTIDFVYDDDCPNVLAARDRLRDACTQLGIAAVWNEWNRSVGDVPDEFVRVGSPTILVNGCDIDGPQKEAAASCCRVYSSDGGTASGVPPIEAIVIALAPAMHSRADG